MKKGEVYERNGERRIIVLLPGGLIGLTIDEKNGVDFGGGGLPPEEMRGWTRLGTAEEIYPKAFPPKNT